MPSVPLPPELERFVAAARPAVVGTVRPDGSPVTSAVWYGWDKGRVLLSMDADGPRIRNLRNNPRVALTILGESWYDQVSLLGAVAEVRDDPDLADLDTLSIRYDGVPYPERDIRCVSVLVAVERWHTWGNPGATA
jgi:PPOX class probable F420-dependent enzyme